MKNNYISVNEPMLNGNEKKYVNECIDSGWISSEGPFVSKFENEFANKVGRKHAIAVTNGSTALDAAVQALDIGPGDEVIMPTFTIISCILQLIRVKALPVLVDCDPVTWNMDVTQIESKITSRTKAIMIVHIYGLPVDLNPILTLASKYDLKIIEDAAEMHGQTYYNKPCGSFGDISIFSFYPNKLITTGEGGMIVTDDDDIANKCRLLRNLYFQPPRRFIHEDIGWNLRMTNIQAALGLAQLERLDEFVARKRNMGKYYTEMLEQLKDKLQLPLPSTDYAFNIYWVFGIVINNNVNLDAIEVMNLLHKKGIGTRPFFYPMHKQPVFIKSGLFVNESYPVAEKLANRGFYIPSGLNLSKQEMETVVQKLFEVFN